MSGSASRLSRLWRRVATPETVAAPDMPDMPAEAASTPTPSPEAPPAPEPELVASGWCPVCRQAADFTAAQRWYRDHLFCSNCGSIPRERAFAWALDRFCPDWRARVLHESSPCGREVSLRMKRGCRRYVGSQFFADVPSGGTKNGVRCEDMERMSFADESVDLHVHLDVLEHVNHPDRCFAEIERTLRPGGMTIFTTPVYEGKLTTERRAEYNGGEIIHHAPPEYHGNPVSAEGALVTFHYGADFAELIQQWAPRCGVTMLTLNDSRLGILGKFREVFVVTKYAA